MPEALRNHRPPSEASTETESSGQSGGSPESPLEVTTETPTSSMNKPIQSRAKAAALWQRMDENPVQQIFGGLRESQVRCLVCGSVSQSHELFLDLSLPVAPPVGWKSSIVSFPPPAQLLNFLLINRYPDYYYFFLIPFIYPRHPLLILMV